MSRAARVPALALVVALVLTGCGGDDGGDPRAFAVQADHACATLGTAVHELRDGLLRTDGSSDAVALGTALSRYATDVRRTADGLARTTPPRDEAAFRDAAVQGLRRHARAMRRAATQVRAGREATALRDEVRGGAMPTVPGSLLADAPSCRRAAG